jgi:choline dehydrogenase-like flavoprotein
MRKTEMRYVIVGAGAIGTSLAAQFDEAGVDCILLGRGAQLAHLRQHGLAALGADHQIVGQQHGKRLLAHQRLGAQHGVAQTHGPGLAHKGAVHVAGLDGAHQLQQFLLAGRFQLGLQFVGRVEVVFNGALAAARHKNHVADTGGIGFFHRVLDQRLVHHGQHLFRAGLGGGQKACAQSGNGENGFANGGGNSHGTPLDGWVTV